MTKSTANIIHGTAVAVDEKAVLVIGASGSGKSALALQLIALGANLIADDRCKYWMDDGHVWIGKPSTLPRAIEARGIGLLNAPIVGPTKIVLVVNMDETSNDRIPLDMTFDIAGHQVKMIDKTDGPHFPSAILLYLKHGFAT